MQIRRRNILLSFSVVACLAMVLFYHAVDNSLSDDDRKYIPLYLDRVIPLRAGYLYKDELNYIVSVQRSVLDVASKNEGILHYKKREPKEVYNVKKGLCYDRSRVIEKILRYAGFRTRHVSMYTEQAGFSLKSIVTPGIPSHAVTEVLTKKGWLVVDSNAPWVSLDKDLHPISIDSIKEMIKKSSLIDWAVEPPTDMYLNPFVFVYGLYSRHGKFYPPYSPVPDIHYAEFLQNFCNFHSQ